MHDESEPPGSPAPANPPGAQNAPAFRPIPNVPVEMMGISYDTALVLEAAGLATSLQVAVFVAENKLTSLIGVGARRAREITAALERLHEEGSEAQSRYHQLVEELRAGGHAGAIARRYGVSLSTVTRIKEEGGMSRAPSRPQGNGVLVLDQNDDVVLAVLTAGAPSAVVAEHYRVSRKTLLRWLELQEDAPEDPPMRPWLRGAALKEFIAEYEAGVYMWPGMREAALAAHCQKAAARLVAHLRGVLDPKERLIKAGKVARRAFPASREMVDIRARRAYALRVLRLDFDWDHGRIKDRIGAPQDWSMLDVILNSDEDLPIGGRPDGLRLPRKVTEEWFVDLAVRSHREYEELRTRGRAARAVREETIREMLGSGGWTATGLSRLTGISASQISRIYRFGAGGAGGGSAPSDTAV